MKELAQEANGTKSASEQDHFIKEPVQQARSSRGFSISSRESGYDEPADNLSRAGRSDSTVSHDSGCDELAYSHIEPNMSELSSRQVTKPIGEVASPTTGFLSDKESQDGMSKLSFLHIEFWLQGTLSQKNLEEMKRLIRAFNLNLAQVEIKLHESIEQQSHDSRIYSPAFSQMLQQILTDLKLFYITDSTFNDIESDYDYLAEIVDGRFLENIPLGLVLTSGERVLVGRYQGVLLYVNNAVTQLKRYDQIMNCIANLDKQFSDLKVSIPKIRGRLGRLSSVNTASKALALSQFSDQEFNKLKSIVMAQKGQQPKQYAKLAEKIGAVEMPSLHKGLAFSDNEVSLLQKLLEREPQLKSKIIHWATHRPITGIIDTMNFFLQTLFKKFEEQAHPIKYKLEKCLNKYFNDKDTETRKLLINFLRRQSVEFVKKMPPQVQESYNRLLTTGQSSVMETINEQRQRILAHRHELNTSFRQLYTRCINTHYTAFEEKKGRLLAKLKQSKVLSDLGNWLGSYHIKTGFLEGRAGHFICNSFLLFDQSLMFKTGISGSIYSWKLRSANEIIESMSFYQMIERFPAYTIERKYSLDYLVKTAPKSAKLFQFYQAIFDLLVELMRDFIMLAEMVNRYQAIYQQQPAMAEIALKQTFWQRMSNQTQALFWSDFVVQAKQYFFQPKYPKWYFVKSDDITEKVDDDFFFILPTWKRIYQRLNRAWGWIIEPNSCLPSKRGQPKTLSMQEIHRYLKL